VFLEIPIVNTLPYVRLDRWLKTRWLKEDNDKGSELKMDEYSDLVPSFRSIPSLETQDTFNVDLTSGKPVTTTLETELLVKSDSPFLKCDPGGWLNKQDRVFHAYSFSIVFPEWFKQVFLNRPVLMNMALTSVWTGDNFSEDLGVSMTAFNIDLSSFLDAAMQKTFVTIGRSSSVLQTVFSGIVKSFTKGVSFSVKTRLIYPLKMDPVYYEFFQLDVTLVSSSTTVSIPVDCCIRPLVVARALGN